METTIKPIRSTWGNGHCLQHSFKPLESFFDQVVFDENGISINPNG